jgi:hypothetical protein
MSDEKKTTEILVHALACRLPDKTGVIVVVHGVEYLVYKFGLRIHIESTNKNVPPGTLIQIHENQEEFDQAVEDDAKRATLNWIKSIEDKIKKEEENEN